MNPSRMVPPHKKTDIEKPQSQTSDTNSLESSDQIDNRASPLSRFHVSEPLTITPSSRFSPEHSLKNPSKTLKSNFLSQISQSTQRCPKNFISSSHKSFPMSKSILKASGMQFCVHVEVLPASDSAVDVPCVDSGDSIIVRCKNCRAYINPYSFFKSANLWECNFCDTNNKVPSGYSESLDSDGLRVDRNEKPELYSCYYDFYAPSDYSNRIPQIPIYYFLVDVSVESIRTGLLYTFCQAMPDAINELAKNSRSKLCVITFDSAVHFYDIRSDGSSPRMTVVSDLSEMCLPPAEQMLVNVTDSREALLAFFANLENIHYNSEDTDSALGPALLTVKEKLGPLGGKVLVFAAAEPSVGKGKRSGFEAVESSGLFANLTKSKPKNNVKPNQAESWLMTDTSNFYGEIGREMNDLHFMVNVFKFSRQGVPSDAGSVGELARYTSGRYFFYEVGEESESCELQGDLLYLLSPQVAWESVMRVRASGRLRHSEMMGAFEVKNMDLMCFPVANGGQTVSVTIDFPSEDSQSMIFTNLVYFQSALLFTNSEGMRMIRVYNLALPVASSVRNFVESVDIENYCAFTAKLGLEKCVNIDFPSGRSFLQSAVTTLMCKLVTFAKRATSSTQELPAVVRYMAVLALGQLKSTAFKELMLTKTPPNALNILPQRRFAHLSFLRCANIEETRLYFNPIVFSLLDLLCVEAFEESTVGALVADAALPLNSLVFGSHSLLLFFGSLKMVMRVRTQCEPEVLQALFGVSAVTEESKLALTAVGSNALRERLEVLLNFLRRLIPSKSVRLKVVVESASADRALEQFLIEERTHSVMSLEEFLKFVLKAVNTM